MKSRTGTALHTLRMLLGLGAIALLIAATVCSYEAVAHGVTPGPVDVYPSDEAAGRLLQSMGVAGGSTVVAQVSEMDRVTAVLVAFPVVVVCILLAAILWLLTTLLREADAGRPFAADNVKRLRIVARLTLLTAVVGWWLGPALNAWAQVRLDSASIHVSTSLTPVLVALGAYSLVSIWQRGAELAEFEEHAV